MLIIHHIEMIHKWGKSEKLRLEQRVISTAIVYMWRFYLKNDIADCDPLLLGPTALLLASKIEECPQNFKNIVGVLPSDYPYSMHSVIECEGYLMEQLNFNLSVFHAYKPLELYMRQFELSTVFKSEGDFIKNYQMCLNFVNDSYFSAAVCLQYPPHMIALTAIYMCGILFDQSQSADPDWSRKWFYDLNIDMNELGEITDGMLQMYKLIHQLKTGDEIGMILLKIDSIRREALRREERFQMNQQPQPLLQQQQQPPALQQQPLSYPQQQQQPPSVQQID